MQEPAPTTSNHKVMMDKARAKQNQRRTIRVDQRYNRVAFGVGDSICLALVLALHLKLRATVSPPRETIH